MLPAHASAPESEPAAAVFAAYLEHLRLRGRGNTAYTQAARSFLRRWPHVQDWADIALHRQLAANSSTRPFVTFRWSPADCSPATTTSSPANSPACGMN